MDDEIKLIEQEPDINNRRVDTLCRLLEGSEKCTSMILIGNDLFLADNEFYSGVTLDSKHAKYI
jgi:hypothetical protein